jgi:D-glycero-D-manno-heptose 1,7-bisphosphate phosphatase
MILKAATLLNLQLDQSWIIGDRVTDLLAGRRARLAGGLHVATGEGNCPDERRAALAIHEPDSFTVQGIASIAEARWYLPWFNG